MNSLCFFLLLLFACKPLCSLTKPIPEQMEVRPHYEAVFDEFLHAVHQAVSVITRHQSAATVFCVLASELGISFRYRALIRDCEQAHPAAENTKGVHSVEGLGPSRYLSDC
jgi:hypothetical protein